jgi:hypothetical protein
VKFRYGYYFPGKLGHRWSKRYYSPAYRSWFYYSPTTLGWYYWNGPRGVYYPAAYLPYAAPTVADAPVPPEEVPTVGAEEAPSLPPPPPSPGEAGEAGEEEVSELEP